MLNDFFTFSDLKREAGKIGCQVSFNAGHEVFKGHFPHQPVVPGVCSMAIVRLLLEEQMNRKLQLQRAGHVKFLQLLLPESRPEVVLTYEPKEEGIQVNATFTLEEKPVFKMSGTYVEKQ